VRAAGLLEVVGARASRLAGRAAARAERGVKAQGERIFAAGQARSAAKKERIRASRGLSVPPPSAQEPDARAAAAQGRE
jgi:hypothetical protein